MLTPEDLEGEALTDHWRIEPLLVRDWDDGEGDMQALLVPVTTAFRAEIAETFAGYFHEEAGFDFTPFYARDWQTPSRHLYLIGSRQWLRLVPVAVGAAEIRIVQSKPVLMWAWLHPFERGKSDRWRQAWDALTAIHGDLLVQAPLRPAMEAFVKRIDLPKERIVSVH